MFDPGEPWDIRPACRALLDLASAIWMPHEIRLAGAVNGWPVVERRWGTGFDFDLGGRLWLRISFGLNAVAPPAGGIWPPHGQVLLYYHWEGNYLRDEEFKDFGRVDFDRAYEVSRERIRSQLGHPEFEGVCRSGWWEEHPCYHFAIWQGHRGLLILQQGELDLQCGGVDVSVCLHPWQRGTPLPCEPILVNRR